MVYFLVWMPCFYIIYFCSVLDLVAHFSLVLAFEKYKETENSLSNSLTTFSYAQRVTRKLFHVWHSSGSFLHAR